MTCVQPDKIHPEKPPADDALASVLTTLGVGYSADLTAIVEKISNRPPVEVVPEQTSEPVTMSREDGIKQFALARINANNISGAIDFIQRQAPDLLDWLQKQLPAQTQEQVKIESPKRTNHVASDRILIDAEAGRVARLIGQFAVYRAWAFAHSIDDGDGRVMRQQLEDIWRKVGVATSKRHTRRMIQKGTQLGYWTQDKTTKRIYLFGQMKVTIRLVDTALESGFGHLIETNKPGKRRVHVNLSGTLQQASAHLYAAWLLAKDPQTKGTIISRDLLCDLWQVSVPTLLTWEEMNGIGKTANFAQTNDTTLDSVPRHAYLTLNRDDSTSAAWRLPNTYTVNDRSIQQHSHTGKSTYIRHAVCKKIALAEQRGYIGDSALPGSDKRYFTDSDAYEMNAFQACDRFLRKLSRRNGDVFERRYFYVGSRYGVQIFEPYNLESNAQETNIAQRKIWQELRDLLFIAARWDFECAVRWL